MNEYLTLTMWLTAGVCMGFFYEWKKKPILIGTASLSGIYALGIFFSVSFPQLQTYLTGLTSWATTIGSGGIASPIGFMAGQTLGQRILQ